MEAMMRKVNHRVFLIFVGVCILINAGAHVYSQEAVSETTRRLMRESSGRNFLRSPTPQNIIIQTSPGVSSGGEDMVLNQLEMIEEGEGTNYILVPGDLLEVKYNNADDTETLRFKISNDGYITMPLMGQVKVEGLNLRQAESILNEGLGRFIRVPGVQIKVNTFGKYMMIGEVGSPGIYSIAEDLTVMDALFVAGGYLEETAQLTHVVVMRGVGDRRIRLSLNLQRMLDKGKRSQNIIVKPDDIIYVPSTLVSRVDEFVDKILGYVSTWYSLGGQNIITPGYPFFGPYQDIADEKHKQRTSYY